MTDTSGEDSTLLSPNITVDREDHQILVTVESIGFRGTFAVRPWIGIDELQVAIEDLTKELSLAVGVAVDVDEWDVCFDDDLEADRSRLVTDGGARTAPSMAGDSDELLHVPDRFRKGGDVRGKSIKRARLVEVETAHPGPDRQVLELHTEDGAAYRFQRYGSSEDFSWLHWQYPGRDPRENHGRIPYAVQVYVALVNREGLDRFREDVRTIPALDPDESQQIRSDGGRKIRRQVDKLREAIESSVDSPSVVELSLRDALEASEDPEVNYHIRQALQHLAVREEDREGGSR